LSNLNANKSTCGVGGDALVGGPTINEINYMKDVEALKTKLKCAAKHISQLIQEKQQLIEMSNQLRGEMQKLKRIYFL
jgi:predicted nuclease with TOPRIM domain